MRSVLVALAASSLVAATARAGGVTTDTPSPRSIGRAGATLVSDDGDGALALSPAALARRDQRRVRVGLSFHDPDLHYDDLAAGTPPVGDTSGPTLSPSLSAAFPWGPLVVAASLAEPTVFESSLPSPAFGQPPQDVSRLFPHRYSGLAFSMRSRALRLGVAARITDWMAIGTTLSGHHIELEETRVLWGGFSGRDGLADPSRDLSMTMSGTDRFVPEAGLGLLLAPASIPVEMTVAASVRAGASLEGTAAAERQQSTAPTLPRGWGTSRLDLPAELLVTAGARAGYSIVSLEVGTILRRFNGSTRSPSSWTIREIRIADQSGLETDIDAIPSQWTSRNHATAQGALELELLPGFLWLTGGYRYQWRSSSLPHLTPTTADLGGHTTAVGAEVYSNGVTATIGYSRSFVASKRHLGSESTLVNPFDGGTTTIGNGLYDRSDDRIGFTLEFAWEAPLTENVP